MGDLKNEFSQLFGESLPNKIYIAFTKKSIYINSLNKKIK